MDIIKCSCKKKVLGYQNFLKAFTANLHKHTHGPAGPEHSYGDGAVSDGRFWTFLDVFLKIHPFPFIDVYAIFCRFPWFTLPCT